MRVLVGGVGYRYLRDGSVGPYLSDVLAERATNGIEVEDLSYDPVALSMNLQERPPYDRVVLFAAVERGREPGSVERYRWDRVLPPAEEVQELVAEAVSGVISLDNMLAVCGSFGGLPEDVRVIEVEPEDMGWGDGFSRTVEAKLPEVIDAIWNSTKP